MQILQGFALFLEISMESIKEYFSWKSFSWAKNKRTKIYQCFCSHVLCYETKRVDLISRWCDRRGGTQIAYTEKERLLIV